MAHKIFAYNAQSMKLDEWRLTLHPEKTRIVDVEIPHFSLRKPVLSEQARASTIKSKRMSDTRR